MDYFIYRVLRMDCVFPHNRIKLILTLCSIICYGLLVLNAIAESVPNSVKVIRSSSLDADNAETNSVFTSSFVSYQFLEESVTTKSDAVSYQYYELSDSGFSSPFVSFSFGDSTIENGFVSNVRAVQRSGTQLIDIYYDLSGDAGSKLAISLTASDNQGTTYAVRLINISGDAGSKVSIGNNKMITWDAGKDVPGQYLANMKFRVSSPNGGNFADSGIVVVETRVSPITILGRVREAKTLAAVPDATVMLAGILKTTDASGDFLFPNVNLYEATKISVGKSGFASYESTVPHTGIVIQYLNDIFLLTSSGNEPRINSIKPKYNGMFLSGMSFFNDYTANVNWAGHQPKSVEFYVNNLLCDTVLTGTSEATLSIDMGKGFVGSLTLGMNYISTVAVSSDGTRSAPFLQMVRVIPVPDILKPSVGGLFFFQLLPGNNPIFSFSVEIPDKSMVPLLLKEVPFLKKTGLDISLIAGFDYAVSDGDWSLYVGSGGRDKIKTKKPKFLIGPAELDIDVKLQAEGIATQKDGLRIDKEGLELNASLEGELFNFLISEAIGVGAATRVIDALKYVGADPNSIQRVNVYGQFEVSVPIMAEFEPPPTKITGGLGLGIGLKAAYEPDFIVAKGSISLGGRANGEWQFVPEFAWKSLSAEVYVGISFSAFLVKAFDEEFVVVNYKKDFAESDIQPSRAIQMSRADSNNDWVIFPVKSKGVGVLDRSYLSVGPEGFVGNRHIGRIQALRKTARTPLEAFQSMGNSKQTISLLNSSLKESSIDIAQVDLLLNTNVFPNSQPAMAKCDKELLLLYVTDNGTSNALQFTDIKWSRYDGQKWSEPAVIQTNSQAEFSPHVVFDGNGDAIAVWERVGSQDFNHTNLLAMSAQMEIVWSRWDHLIKAWTMPLPLTANDYLDHAPLLCGPMANGDVLLAWTKNEQSLLMGSGVEGATSNSIVMSTRWSPQSQTWEEPKVLVSNLAYRLSQSLSGSINIAVYAWSRRLEGDATHSSGTQVFYCAWKDGVWSAPVQFTDNTNINCNARVEVGQGGHSYLVWQSGTNLLMSRDLSTNTVLARANSQTAGFADYSITIGPADNLVMLWQELSQDGSDAYYSVFDPFSDTWSKDARLFSDPPLERSFAPVWDSVGNLTFAYDKVQMLMTNKLLTLEDGSSLTISNVSQAGQVDLWVTKRRLIKDLSLEPGDFIVQADNYLPGAAVTLTANYRNIGDVAVNNVMVGFYDGDPASTGVLITNIVVSDWLNGAATNTVCAVWIVPSPATNHVIYAKVDPNNMIAEYNEDNNVQSVNIGGTDLSLALANYRVETNGALRVFAQVQNIGAPASRGSVLAIRQYGSTNEPLATVPVPVLEPGQLAQLALDLPSGTQHEGEQIYALTVDDNHVSGDINTNNNTSNFAAKLVIDTDMDGIQDSWMIAHFGHPTANASDRSLPGDDPDGDGMTNLAEYIAGTDPNDANSYLRIESITGNPITGIQLSWGAVSNKIYTLQRSPVVDSGYSNLIDHIQGTPPENIYLDTSATNESSHFYRIKME